MLSQSSSAGRSRRNILGSLGSVGAVVVFSFCSSPAQAQLVTYNLTDSYAATTVNSSLITASLIDYSHLDHAGFADDGFGQLFQTYNITGSTTAAASLANNSYFSFTLTAQPGKVFSLANMSFEVAKGGASDPRGFFVTSSVDNFVNPLISQQLPMGAAQAPQAVNVGFGSSYFNLSSVTFRFYGYVPASTNSIDYRNLVVNSAGAPEPTSLALLLGGSALPLVGLVRRKLQRR